MKEQMQNIPSSEIKWPQDSIVEVSPAVDFAYIMRKDGNFTMSPIAQRLASDYRTDEGSIRQILLEDYDTFFSKLADTFKWAYAAKGNFELHIYDPDNLDKAVRDKSQGNPIVSLDPLMSDGVLEHRVSRGYYINGKNDFGQIARPGNQDLHVQAGGISTALQDKPVVIAEDDIFSGGSVIASLTQLIDQGVNIHKVVPGIQIGNPEKLSDMGIQVDPIVKYETTDGADIFDKVDLGDPRDYLLGASGLVVKLPNGELGRAPYILPFVSSSARAGVPVELERQFSLNVLQANYEFFSSVEYKTGLPILLEHMDPNFKIMMHEIYGIDPHTPMHQIVAWTMDNIDRLWSATNEKGELQAKIEDLQLPRNMVLVDVNGTLFPDESPTGEIAEEDLESLKLAVEQAKQKGLSVGLCSDSPLPQLKQLAGLLGFDGPIVAENGNILSNNEKSIVINHLNSVEEYKSAIATTAGEHGMQQKDDCIAPEFGGTPQNNLDNNWSFGANRVTSITVFGASQFIESLGEQFNSSGYENSVDCSPEYNYFAIHPGANYKENKAATLSLLSEYGYNVIMIGNSLSDWVDPSTGVQCAYVSGSNIPQNIAEKASYLSNQRLIKGVVDIMEHIQ